MTAAQNLPPTTVLPTPKDAASAVPSSPAAIKGPSPDRTSLQVPNVLPGHRSCEARSAAAGEAQTTRPTIRRPDPELLTLGGSSTPPPTEVLSAPVRPASAEGKHDPGQREADARVALAGVADQRVAQAQATSDYRTTTGLDDPLLYLAAASLDDLERTRIAAENRLRQLTRNVEDADGEERGFGLTSDNPQVRAQESVVDGLASLEHGAELTLKRRLRLHPLHGWIKGTVGLGEKQAARLLAAVGDPYWNSLHDRPRTVSELWSYCGYRVVPAGPWAPDTQNPRASGPQNIPADQRRSDDQTTGVGGEQSDGDPGHEGGVAHQDAAGVAVRRKKGQRANWSTVAKMRAYLIAESCIKQARSPYRAVYEKRRQHTATSRPEWTAGHSHNDALRVVAKEVLKDMWRAARDVHGPIREAS